MKQFFLYYQKSSGHQLLIDISVGTILATVSEFVKTYLFADIEFLKYLAVAMLIDTILGLYMAIKEGKVSSKGFGLILNKFINYGAVLVIIHLLTHFTVKGEKNQLFDWFTQIGYGALIVRESISILKNAGKIAPGKVPPWILKRLEGFDKSGKPEDLTNPINIDKNAVN